MQVKDLVLERMRTLPQTYEEQKENYTYFYSVIACGMAIVLILAGTLLDRFFYPEHYSHFLFLRFAASAIIGIAMWQFMTGRGRKFFGGMLLLWTSVPQVMICYMISLTGGEESIYFIGLTYAFAAVAVIFPLTILEAVSFSLLTIGMYLLACLVGTGESLDTARFSGNLVFLTFSAIVMLTIAIYSDRWRRHSFEMQSEIKRQRDELSENHRTLTDTKLHLVQSEKMASLGTLAAGLLHELNNPINYSAIAITLAREYLAEDDVVSAKETIADADEGISRVKVIVADLKTFAYQRGTEDPLLNSFNLLEAVRIAGRLTAHERGDIELAVDIDPNLCVEGERASIASVFINLMSNAAHALNKAKRDPAGRIAVRAGPVPGTHKVMVTVYDNGVGIPAGIIHRVFEPFFSTRKVGEGLGLGLSISYAIVQRHRSQLMVSSLEGEYTEFSFEMETHDVER